MAYDQTVNDLRSEALWRAGEPQDSSSDFWDKSLQYMNRIQLGLVGVHSVAVGRDLASSAGIYAWVVQPPITDWWWARSLSVLTTKKAHQTTATLTEGSADLTMNTLPGAGVDVPDATYRMLVQGKGTAPAVVTYSSGDVTMDAVWPEETGEYTITFWETSYTLANDFLRFASPPFVHVGARGISAPVISRELRNRDFPLASAPKGPPTRFALNGPQSVTVNAWDTDRRYRFEYEYIQTPTELVAGGTPEMPIHHRSILSVGAAMLMLFDKEDDKAANLASEYRESLAGMVQEHRKMMSAGSPTYGVFKTRGRQGAFQRGQQSMGELYLV
jgi:hypothetical protein